MTAKIIDGKTVAQEIRADLARRVTELKETKGIVPGLAVILVGNDPASHVYVRNKIKACQNTGLRSVPYYLPETTAEAELLDLVRDLNADPQIHGILVQLPLPEQMDAQKVLLAIDPAKDVDGLHPLSIGLLNTNQPGFRPCTPLGVMELIKRTGTEIKGKHAVVVGASNLVGKPAGMLLLQAEATVTICHKATVDLAKHTREADILVAAAGVPGLITADMVKQGAVVIDVGTTKIDGRLHGDVDFDNVVEKAAWITPVPGGVGPMTITMLLWNTVEAVTRN